MPWCPEEESNYGHWRGFAAGLSHGWHGEISMEWQDQRCGNCRFYRRDAETTRRLSDDSPLHPDDYEAECRRFPPTRGDPALFGEITEAHNVLYDFFSGPIVNTGYWCGEWKSRSDER